jgi:hypothetical protein
MRIQDLSWPRMAAWRRVRGATLGQNGAAMVEFAFVAPLLICLLGAIMESCQVPAMLHAFGAKLHNHGRMWHGDPGDCRRTPRSS